MKQCKIPRWQLLKNQLNNLEYQEFVDRFKADPIGVCIDVRTEVEYTQQYIDGSININYLSPDLADRLEQIDCNKNCYVYCRTGRRSLRVCVILNNLGFKNVYNMIAGINAK